MTTYYHGSHRGNDMTRDGWQLHEGACLTDSLESAQRYAGPQGTVYEVTIGDCVVERCGGYDWDDDEAPADRQSFRAAAADRGVDVLRYEDVDERGGAHDCYRVVSQRAIAAAVVRVLEAI